MKVRRYKKNDFNTVTSWWKEAGEPVPSDTMLPLDSTYILEIAGTPALCISLFLPNMRQWAMVENFVANPKVPRDVRREYMAPLLRFLEDEARSRGYQSLLCLAYREPLKRRYQDLGFTPVMDNITSFVRSL